MFVFLLIIAEVALGFWTELVPTILLLLSVLLLPPHIRPCLVLLSTKKAGLWCVRTATLGALLYVTTQIRRNT
jgi:hypothetical protein